MTVKEFFKSKSFKCIVVLVCIAVISGGLLAVLNDLLYVSDDERTARAIKTIYKTEIGFTSVEINESDATNDFGSINSVFLLEDGNYLIQATGIDGYKGGTVTTWAVAEFIDGKYNGLTSVSVESYDKQTLMSAFSGNYFKVYTQKNDIIDGGGFYSTVAGDNVVVNVQSAATYSSKAINNAVNSTLTYIRAVLQGGTYE